MEKDESVEIRGLEVKPGHVRKLATKVGIPADVPVPQVIIAGKGTSKDLQEWPQIQRDVSKGSTIGYVITIPERMLGEPQRVDQNIRHELAHYLEYLEPGASVGQDADPYIQAVKEVRADLRGGVEDLPLALSGQASNLKSNYSLSDREALRLVMKAARSLGVGRRNIGKARRLYRESS